MAYTPFVWKDDPTGGTPITATRLNAIEGALSTASVVADNALASATGVASAISSIQATPKAWKNLAGTGIDLTGTSDSTPAVQALFAAAVAGDVIAIPTGAVIRLSDTISLPTRVRITGGGILRWTAGIAGKTALLVQADGTEIDSIRVETTVAPNQTNDKQAGILIRGSYVRIIGVHVDGLQQAITVDPGGEYHDIVIANNIVTNVPGSGDGPSNVTSNLGEDRGDGICSWGAAVTITGNRVSAKAGADARIGIHVESLAGSHAVGSYAHEDQLSTITGNVVTGQFRRGIVCESVPQTVISGNTVADSTWWSLALINTWGCLVQNNSVKWTRTTSDNQGAAWSPTRSAVMVYGTGYSNSVQNNTVVIAPGATIFNCVTVLPDGGGTQDNLLISHNNFAVSQCYQGINLNGSASQINNTRIVGNVIANATNTGIYGWKAADVEIINNRITGVYGNRSIHGVHLEQLVSMARVDGNTIYWTNVAISSYSRNALSTYNNNLIYQANVGFDLYGNAGCSINSNRLIDVATPGQNIPAGSPAVGNNFSF